jgi:hypothetical protein
MPLTHDADRDPDHDNEELVRYLLGLLPDEVIERIDEASISDDEVAARLRIVETDLIDSYVRGQLTGARLERFESYYLLSPRRRESVRMAAGFVRVVDRSVARTQRVTWKDRIPGRTSLARIVAAAALVIIVCGLIQFQAARTRHELTLATSENGAVEARLQRTGGPTVGAATARELGRARSSAAASALSPSAPASESPDGKRAPSPSEIVAVVLLPPTRAATPIPTLAIPPGADRVRFDLRLESNDFPSYRVALKHPATSHIPWRSDWIVSRPSADQASVSVVVPAKLLKPQHYSLDLTGRDAGGRAEVIGSYTVRVVQP